MYKHHVVVGNYLKQEILSFSKDDVSEGTVFIKSLCEVFDTYAYKNLPKNNLSLAQMITKINESVMSQGVQIADPVFRMKREVYFLPKNVNIIIAIFTL